MNKRLNKLGFKNRIRSVGGMLFFLLVVSATFYPVVSAAIFGKTVTDSIDSRGVLGASTTGADVEPSGIFENPVITIAFDDGWESTYKNGLPLLNEFNFKASFYMLSDSFNDTQYMSIDQVSSLKAQGHHIGSHTVTHAKITELTLTDLRYELMGSQKQLESKFGKIQDFAAPYGSYNDDSIAEIKKLYRSHRTVNSGINTFENYDQYQLKSPNIKNTTSVDEIKAWIERAQKEKGWLILTYHEIDSADREYSTKPDDFKKHMQLIKDSGIKVATLDKVLNDIKDTYGQP